MRKIDKIVIHCSDTDSGSAASIRKYHIQHNGWADIGYHFVIDREGHIETGRPLAQAGAHVSGENAASIGICLIGKKVFSEDQYEALREIVLSLKARFGKLPCYPHNYFKSAKAQGKTCPNFDIKKVLGALC
jgi:N-acetyl-anhydromuramyl-L-alanine amidase AmpD